MNKKIFCYLRNKEESEYTFLDKVLVFYAENKLQDLLLLNNATHIECFPSITKTCNSIQIYFQFYNMCASLEFREAWYEYCKYELGCSSKEIENNIIRASYNDNFTIEIFIEEFIQSMKADPRLVKTNTGKKNKQKIYRVISYISFCIPCIVIGILALYVILTGTSVELNPWFLLLILLSLINWLVFDVKSKRS